MLNYRQEEEKRGRMKPATLTTHSFHRRTSEQRGGGTSLDIWNGNKNQRTDYLIALRISLIWNWYIWNSTHSQSCMIFPYKE